MNRKKWTEKTDPTYEDLKSREKRKWQINLRRYVLDKSPCPYYAPFFGLDIIHMREWFECQFGKDLHWQNFGTAWQFEHVLPVAYFDHSDENALALCWNFVNLKVKRIESVKNSSVTDLFAARKYFEEIYISTGYKKAGELKLIIDKIESKATESTTQQQFIIQRKDYLERVKDFTAYEFELLNLGRTIEDISKEVAFFKKNDSPNHPEQK